MNDIKRIFSALWSTTRQPALLLRSCCCTGFKALRSHRKAQWFLNHKMPFIARYISQRTAHKTGIEIHPGAKIGRRVCIDHGNGIVIGETTEVGDDVMIYRG